jgi:hypothetical protein
LNKVQHGARVSTPRQQCCSDAEACKIRSTLATRPSLRPSSPESVILPRASEPDILSTAARSSLARGPSKCIAGQRSTPAALARRSVQRLLLECQPVAKWSSLLLSHARNFPSSACLRASRLKSSRVLQRPRRGLLPEIQQRPTCLEARARRFASNEESCPFHHSTQPTQWGQPRLHRFNSPHDPPRGGPQGTETGANLNPRALSARATGPGPS